MSQFTMQQKIDAVAREIAMRKRVYPSFIARGKITKEKADYELAVMNDVLATLVGLQATQP